MRDKTERFCDQCDFKATSEQAMKKHSISHLEAAVNCDICGKLFGSRTGLTLHMKKMHKEMQDEEKTLNDSTLLQVMFIFKFLILYEMRPCYWKTIFRILFHWTREIYQKLT